MPKLTMVQAINLGLDQEMARDDAVIVLGEDVGQDGGVFRVTDGLLAKYGEARVIDTPLAESGIIGTSIGMALAGLRPVAEMQFCGFSYLMLPQLEGHASRFRSRSHGQFTCPLVVRIPYGGGVRALEHHSEAREVLYAHMPGVKMVAPSGPRNARALIVAAIRDPDPVVYYEPKRSYRAFREEVPEESEVLPIGAAQVAHEGTDLTVITWGAMMRPTLQAIEDLQQARRASIELVDLLTIAPLDVETVATVLDLVAAGVGDTILERGLLVARGGGMSKRIGWVPFADPIMITLAFVTRRDAPLSPAARVMVELVEERLRATSAALAKTPRRRLPS